MFFRTESRDAAPVAEKEQRGQFEVSIRFWLPPQDNSLAGAWRDASAGLFLRYDVTLKEAEAIAADMRKKNPGLTLLAAWSGPTVF